MHLATLQIELTAVFSLQIPLLPFRKGSSGRTPNLGQRNAFQNSIHT